MSPYREPTDAPPGQPLYVSVPAGTTLYRIHSSSFGPTDFNPTVSKNPFGGGRFDSAEGDYSWLYAGHTVLAAVAETLLRDVPLADFGRPRSIPLAQVRGKRLSVVEVKRDLEFVNLSGKGAIALGQDSWLTTCDSRNYGETRHWARKIREWCPDAAGFRWRSRVDNDEFSYVVFGDRITADGLVKSGRPLNLTSARGAMQLRSALAAYGMTVSV